MAFPGGNRHSLASTAGPVFSRTDPKQS